MPIVNIGSTANDGTGATLRAAFAAINTEFARLAALVGESVPRVVDDIADMKAQAAPTALITYALVFVLSDENGQLATFEFDAAIVADDALNGEYVLTAGGGGFRRKGL